jgi:ribosomal protein L21
MQQTPKLNAIIPQEVNLMALTTYEGVVEKGKVRLKTGVRLPENAVVYVIVPEQTKKKKVVHIRTPRLARRKQAGHFNMKVEKA